MVSKWYDKKLYGDHWEELSNECRSTFTCIDCGRVLPKKFLQSDHKVELSKGGRNSLANLGCRCIECHRKKTALNRPKFIPKGLGPKVPSFKLKPLKHV
jgi:5-methylcytosine-specific restriction endonuclease McrA